MDFFCSIQLLDQGLTCVRHGSRDRTRDDRLLPSRVPWTRDGLSQIPENKAKFDVRHPVTMVSRGRGTWFNHAPRDEEGRYVMIGGGWYE
jgi:hypothetical protein